MDIEEKAKGWRALRGWEIRFLKILMRMGSGEVVGRCSKFWRERLYFFKKAGQVRRWGEDLEKFCIDEPVPKY
jgi:hypothetical protein